VDLNQAKSALLDQTLVSYLEELRVADEEKSSSTLGYTHSLHRFWRQVLRMLPVAPGSSVLDAGSGLGILAFELAANVPVQVVGSDIDPDFIEHSRVLEGRLAAAGLFTEGAQVSFCVGDVRALEFADASFDLVFVRELLQFIPDPVQALKELLRVLKPGGYACVSDMDDGLRITWPPPSPPLERLVDAVSEIHHDKGGDRQIGRKLTAHLRGAGFGINSIVVLPEAQHRVVDFADNERALIIEQLHAARERVVAGGAMDAESFDRDLGELEQQDPFEEFRLNAKLVVLAQRPAVA
jgi:ubiquinone/menaquinone biosynthesis C-methylase UbiE